MKRPDTRFCLYCGAQKTPLKHLKKPYTYKKNCTCPTERSGDLQKYRQSVNESMNRLNQRTRSVAHSNGNPYSEADISFITENYYTLTYEQIAYHLGRCRNAIAVKILRLRESGKLPDWRVPSGGAL